MPDSETLAVFSQNKNWQLFGQVVGAFLVWGPVSDLLGRRRVLLLSITIYSLASIATAAVQSTFDYTVIRFFAGIGLGGELGAAVTLISEALPGSRQGRQRTIATMIIGFFGMFGVVTAATLAKTGIGWRMTFVIGGILGLMLFVLRIRIQESLLFQANVGHGSITNLFRRLLSLPTLGKLEA